MDPASMNTTMTTETKTNTLKTRYCPLLSWDRRFKGREFGASRLDAACTALVTEVIWVAVSSTCGDYNLIPHHSSSSLALHTIGPTIVFWSVALDLPGVAGLSQ